MSDAQETLSDAQEIADVPVLTQVVEELAPPPAATAPESGAALEAMARAIEQAVLARLAPEIERVVAQTVREAVAASLAQALGEPRRE
jgi:hypothetical protein